MEMLSCQKVMKVDDGTWEDGSPRFYHRKCGLPAAVRILTGQLTEAEAVLCGMHHNMALREAERQKAVGPKRVIDSRQMELL